jgi:hypothetical protein
VRLSPREKPNNSSASWQAIESNFIMRVDDKLTAFLELEAGDCRD